MNEAAGEAGETPADGGRSPFGAETQRYWEMRHALFSRFDDGVKIDEQGLYSAKPEVIALEIGRRLPGDVALDAFCGVGGSAIGLARAGKRVIAMDTDASRVEMARHNARIYGVEDRIEFVVGDCRERMRAGGFDGVYLDPPWGGPDYFKRERFGLGDFSPDGAELLELAFRVTLHVAISVPKNFDWREFERFQRSLYLERNVVGDRVLFWTAYFGSAP